ncbi:MAG TPA: hypothetical protein VN372_09125 [Methanospirillum sp.]|nr:hypothetical protein [Methanospirillum sp.]
MAAGNGILIIIDLILGLVAVIAGNLGFPALTRYLAGSFIFHQYVAMSSTEGLMILLCLVIAVYCYHKVKSKIIRMAVIILIFVPVILMLLSYFSVVKLSLPFQAPGR